MRNLTSIQTSNVTNKHVQLIDPTTGEMHEHADITAISGDQYKTTSTTCQDIVSTGNITLTVETGLAYTPLQDIIVYADAANHMHGEVVSYNTATGELVMDVHQKSGSGNFCNWVVNLDAIKLAEVSVYWGSTDPITAGQAGIEGDLFYKTSTGTNGGTVLETWVYDGTAWIQVDKAATFYKELNQWHVDKNGNDTTGTGADENPVLTVTKALSLASQADAVVVTEGTYAETVTMSVQNVTLRGEGNEYGGLTEINALNVTTASGTSNRVSSLTVLGNVSHTGGAPFYLSDVTINGNYASSSTAYDEIRGSRIQTGTISKTGAGILNIVDSYIGNATFSTANSIIALDNVTIDAGDTLTIGAGVIYSLNDVRGHVAINPAAIPAETAALAGGLTGLAAKSVETSTFNDIRLTNVPTITGATKALVRDTNGVVSEQVFPSGLPSGGTDGQVLTVQPDGSYAWETPSAGSTEVADGVTILGTGTVGDPFRVAPEVSCGVVYFDAATPAASTIFSTDNPPTVDDPALHDLTCATYVSAVDGSFWSSNGTTYATKVFSFQGASDEFVATANRTSFVLTGTPIGKVWFFRNGARLPNTSFSVIGSTVTYIPANNGSAILGAMVAGDIVDIDYVK